jgi:hypothetical protein
MSTHRIIPPRVPTFGQVAESMTPTYQELQQREMSLRVYVQTLRDTIERLGHEIHIVRTMNAQMANQPLPPKIAYIPPPK